jgi:hypothetical protein
MLDIPPRPNLIEEHYPRRSPRREHKVSTADASSTEAASAAPRRPAASPLRGDSVTVIAALKEFAPPGTFVGLRLSGGKTGVFQVRSPEEREAGVPVKVMMSKHRAPLAVADQDPVASRAGLRLSPETTEPSHCVVQRVVVEVARSGADCAPPVAHTCTGLFPCRRKSLSARRTRRRTWRAA